MTLGDETLNRSVMARDLADVLQEVDVESVEVPLLGDVSWRLAGRIVYQRRGMGQMNLDCGCVVDWSTSTPPSVGTPARCPNHDMRRISGVNGEAPPNRHYIPSDATRRAVESLLRSREEGKDPFRGLPDEQGRPQ